MDREHLPSPPLALALARADRQARSLRSALDRVALVLAGAAGAFHRRRAWVDFGYARLEDHTRERFSRSGRWLRDLAALAKAVDGLPGLAAALCGADGHPPIGRVAALLIGRVADPDSLGAWVALARCSTVRELRQAVREARTRGASFLPSHRSVSARLSGTAASTAEGLDQTVFRASTADAAGSHPRANANDHGTTDADGNDDEARTQVRLAVPSAVRAAFDETLDLYRAVVGREATATSFVEDLVAEAASGPHPPDADQRSLLRATHVTQVEQALSRSTANWRHLDDQALAEIPGFDIAARGDGDPLSWRLAGLPGDVEGVGATNGAAAGTDDKDSTASLLRRLDELSLPADGETAAGLDARIRDLLRIQEALERRLGILLAAMGEAGAWLRLHFAGVGHYAEQRLGLSRTQAQTRARVARRLRERPVLRRAYESGVLGIEAASLLLRLPAEAADADRDRAWVTRAGEVTVKRLRDECRALRRASVSAGAPRSSASGPGMPAGLQPLADDAWFDSLRRDRGTSRRRLSELGRLALASRVSNDMLCLRLPAWLADSFLSTLESARRAAESTRLSSTCGRPTPTWVGLLALLDEFVTTWDPPDATSSGRRPSIEEIYARHGWRCAAPGCTSRRNLEDHHLVYRSHGGGNSHVNRICLCRFHHQWGEHGTLARCRGEAPLGVLWRLGRQGVGGRFRNERAVAIFPTPTIGGADCAL